MSESKNQGTIFKTGGVTAIILLAYCLVTMVVLVTVGAQPATAREIFEMLARNRFTGLLRLDILTTLFMPFYFLLFACLYAALRKTHDHSAKIMALLGCVGVTLFLSAPSFLSYLALSDKYAAAGDEAQRAMYLAAGEAILAADIWHSSSAFVGGLLLQTATLLASIIMLRGSAFSKATGWVGVATHGLDLLHLPALLLVPQLGVILMAIGGTLYLAWFPLLARDFFRLAKE